MWNFKENMPECNEDENDYDFRACIPFFLCSVSHIASMSVLYLNDCTGN